MTQGQYFWTKQLPEHDEINLLKFSCNNIMLKYHHNLLVEQRNIN